MSQFVLQPDAAAGVDTYLTDSAAGSNFGTNSYIPPGSGSAGKNWYKWRGLIRFDLRPLIGAKSLDYAELHFQGFNNLLSTQNFYLCRCTRGANSGTPWTELGATWDKYNGTNNWTTAGGDFTTALQHIKSIPTSVLSDFIFSSNDPGMGASDGVGILILARDAVANRGGYLDLLIIGPEIPSNTGLTFYSSDNGTLGLSPSMTINYTSAIYARRGLSRRVASRGAA